MSLSVCAFTCTISILLLTIIIMSNDFSTFITSNEMCIVRELKLQCTMNGSPLLTEFDCLILQLTENLPAISSHSIACPLSIVHICNNLCMFLIMIIQATYFV